MDGSVKHFNVANPVEPFVSHRGTMGNHAAAFQAVQPFPRVAPSTTRFGQEVPTTSRHLSYNPTVMYGGSTVNQNDALMTGVSNPTRSDSTSVRGSADYEQPQYSSSNTLLGFKIPTDRGLTVGKGSKNPIISLTGPRKLKFGPQPPERAEFIETAVVGMPVHLPLPPDWMQIGARAVVRNPGSRRSYVGDIRRIILNTYDNKHQVEIKDVDGDEHNRLFTVNDSNQNKHTSTFFHNRDRVVDAGTHYAPDHEDAMHKYVLNYDP